MTADTRLPSFVESALREGATLEEISETLTDAGWDANEVNTAISYFAGIKFNTPVPRKRKQLFARDFAFYLFLFTILYVATFSLITLGFDVLNYALPAVDEERFKYLAESIRYWAAMCLVFVPVYIAMAWYAEKRKRADPTSPISPSRQWLTYLTLLIAGLTALGDLVVLINGFLSGESTLRFYLKVLYIGAIAGALLAYLSRDVRNGERESK